MLFFFQCSLRESQMKLGRAWAFPPLAENETIISSSLADTLALSTGDSIHLTVNISRYLKDYSNAQLLSLLHSLLPISRLMGIQNSTVEDSDEMEQV